MTKNGLAHEIPDSPAKRTGGAKRIYDSMKLGAEPTPRAAESLGLEVPLWRRAPAAGD